MEKEKIKALIEYHKQWISLLWTAVLVLAGGLAGLLLQPINAVRAVMLLLGILLLTSLFAGLLSMHNEIRELIRRLGDD